MMVMKPSQNVSLADYSTMGLGGSAAYLVAVNTRQEVLEAFNWAAQHQVPALMIGGGSNIVWRDEGYQGLVIVNKLLGYEVSDQADCQVLVKVGAGETWDKVVERTVQAGLTGIEALSLIPGSAGATPVQNVGAYGQEIVNTLDTIEAFDAQAADFVTLKVSECGFAYRTSRFKTTDHGRFYITSLSLRLTKANPQPPYYGSVQQYFEEHKITEVTPAALREAVIYIRSHKLPDPAKTHNTGSFFGNPIISAGELIQLRSKYPDLPAWPLDGGSAKIPAAWLIEQAGFKDAHDPDTGMATWPTQALVLVNETAKTTADLLVFKQKIVGAVHDKFGITLVQEPELLP